MLKLITIVEFHFFSLKKKARGFVTAALTQPWSECGVSLEAVRSHFAKETLLLCKNPVTPSRGGVFFFLQKFFHHSWYNPLYQKMLREKNYSQDSVMLMNE